MTTPEFPDGLKRPSPGLCSSQETKGLCLEVYGPEYIQF